MRAVGAVVPRARAAFWRYRRDGVTSVVSLTGPASGATIARPLGRPTLNSHSDRAGEDVLVDTMTGTRFPAAPTGSLLLSSVPLGWRGIIVEWHHLPPRELSQHHVIGHGISVNTGARPVPFGWNGRNGWRDSVINPGESHFLTQGELNTPRWLQAFDGISIVLQPWFVADVVRDGLPGDRIEFATQRSVNDIVIARYAAAFMRNSRPISPRGRCTPTR
jgi:hypothetical protein